MATSKKIKRRRTDNTMATSKKIKRRTDNTMTTRKKIKEEQTTQ
jgi:hypothetical protein